jgi:hypothetical protein
MSLGNINKAFRIKSYASSGKRSKLTTDMIISKKAIVFSEKEMAING